MGAGAKKSTRQVMLDSTIGLLQRQSAGAVTLDAVLADSGAPRGSVYYHFPGGRNELITAAVELAGERMRETMERASDGAGPQEALAAFADFWKTRLASSEFRAGCPIVAAAVDDEHLVPEAKEAVRGVFARWHDLLVDAFTRAGRTPARAESLATLGIAAVEGAVLMCRLQGSLRPLDDVIAELGPLLA
ncbi:TetR/AcrR family transcriptional regulator [Streptomyces sp. RP5T]|uniref:TetR/AcrR family transcriptional regulator n=1 Tax=unclassified Streptomyces TaxID=2593676 RepID=UPI000F651278|nr:TetR/AcrR family transcriptional regulator [Streptomyces sp. RP5T]RRR79914.1 TetR/AcrR family transcriptional regulator [Streptomyces sp. RP5T]